MREVLVGTALVLQILYSTLLYLGSAVGLFCIAKRNRIPHAWISFLPIFQFYIIGSLCEEYLLLGRRIRHLGWVMVALALLQGYISFFSGFFFVPVKILASLLIALILHKFFYLFTPERATIYAFISVLGRFSLPILLFLLKDTPIKMSAGAYPYPFGNR